VGRDMILEGVTPEAWVTLSEGVEKEASLYEAKLREESILGLL